MFFLKMLVNFFFLSVDVFELSVHSVSHESPKTLQLRGVFQGPSDDGKLERFFLRQFDRVILDAPLLHPVRHENFSGRKVQLHTNSLPVTSKTAL
jgi:hypothetical protein